MIGDKSTYLRKEFNQWIMQKISEKNINVVNISKITIILINTGDFVEWK